MPAAMIDGLETYFETYGSGPPLLMLAPGGFDASIDKWRVASAWQGIDAVRALSQQVTVILYDRRESGRSGGRVERLHWSGYARQAKNLLDHLGIASAYVLGGCMGCSVALGFRRFLSRSDTRFAASLAGRRLPLEEDRTGAVRAPL
jgi:pimeloyl-ACP methyl ester carboxylesterase